MKQKVTVFEEVAGSAWDLKIRAIYVTKKAGEDTLIAITESRSTGGAGTYAITTKSDSVTIELPKEFSKDLPVQVRIVESEGELNRTLQDYSTEKCLYNSSKHAAEKEHKQSGFFSNSSRPVADVDYTKTPHNFSRTLR